MDARNTKYPRAANEAYWTPAWVAQVLLDLNVLPEGCVWEPACGRGDICRVLGGDRHRVLASDIDVRPLAKARVPLDGMPDPLNERIENAIDGLDFLAVSDQARNNIFKRYKPVSIVTNPPYGPRAKTAEAFIRTACQMMHVEDSTVRTVAMLLRADFDSAITRRALFTDANGAGFSEKIVLTKRPRWHWPGKTKDTASPMFNYSWYVWRRGSITKPIIRYAP